MRHLLTLLIITLLATAAASFTPPYLVPTSDGQVVQIGVNTPQDVHPPGWDNSYWLEFSLFNSFGAGVVVPEYSEGGAYVFADIGGHSHPDIAGAVLFDYADATWKRLEHANGGDQWGINENKTFSESQSDGAPYWEVSNTINLPQAVPLPGHPYQLMAERPSAAGGGSKGSVIYVCRAAVGPSWDKKSQSVHAFDLATRIWTRVTDDLYPRDATYEGSVAYDGPRGAYWVTMTDQHNFQSYVYLRTSDWTFQTSGSFSGWMDSRAGVGNRMSIYNGKLIINGADGTLWMFDPDNAPAGVRQIILSGPALPGLFRINRIVYYPPTDVWYYARSDSGYPGNSLFRIAINTSNLTGSVSTVTLSQSLPQVGNFPGDQADAYHMLHYVPSLQCLSWIHSATGYVYLIKPEASISKTEARARPPTAIAFDFPNPMSRSVIFSLMAAAEQTFRLRDSRGRLVEDASRLSAGVYMLETVSGRHRSMNRIVVLQ